MRTLLVDDDIAYRKLCVRYLSNRTNVNYDIHEASNKAEAIEALRALQFDCIVIDFYLPDCSGTELIEQLRDEFGSQLPPVIIFSAEGGEDAAAEALRARAADFLPKRGISRVSLPRSIENAVEKHHLELTIATQNRELAEANVSLRSKSHEIERFYQHVSHEVKTPLAATREFIAIVRDQLAGPVTPQQSELLMHALDSCDQISHHFNELVEITRLDAGKTVLNLERNSIDSVVIRSLTAAKAALLAGNITLEHSVNADVPLFYFDRNRLVQVLSNLIGNAIKYTSPGGKITLEISYYTEERQVEIRVTDTGCGIPEQDLAHIFDRLYQVRGNNDEFSGAGLGLGLSITKEIVELHGGRILAESTVNSGSKFAVRLPIEARESDKEV